MVATSLSASRLEITTPTPTKPSTIYGLSWMRGIASLLVCLFHVKKYIWEGSSPSLLTDFFGYGDFGVIMFFVISGFVIPYSMYQKNYTFDKFFRFLAKRTVRIEPPYVLFVLLWLTWSWYCNKYIWHGTPTFMNVKQFFLNITYLAPFFHVKWINIVFWTLAIEFQFYILTGLLYPLMMKGRWHKYLVYLPILAIGFIIPDEYLTIFHNYIYFIIGFQTFLYFTKNIKLSEFTISVLLAFVYVIVFKKTIAIPFILVTIGGVFFLDFKWKYAMFLSDISYSLYLTHGLIAANLVYFLDDDLPKYFVLTVVMANTLGFAWLFYYFVEKRFLNLSKKIKY